MSSPVEVLQVGDTVAQAQRLMKRSRVRHLPVVDGQGKLIGLVTHRQILGAWLSHGDPGHERRDTVARDVPIEMMMERDVITTWPEAPASDAATLLEAHKIGCLPVLDEGQIVGIITEGDFVRFARLYLERNEAS